MPNLYSSEAAWPRQLEGRAKVVMSYVRVHIKRIIRASRNEHLAFPATDDVSALMARAEEPVVAEPEPELEDGEGDDDDDA